MKTVLDVRIGTDPRRNMTRMLAAGVSILAATGLALSAESPRGTIPASGQQAARPTATSPPTTQVFFNRYQAPVMRLFIAAADGLPLLHG